LREIIQAWGVNPEQILTKKTFSQGAVTYIDAQDRENHTIFKSSAGNSKL